MSEKNLSIREMAHDIATRYAKSSTESAKSVDAYIECYRQAFQAILINERDAVREVAEENKGSLPPTASIYGSK